MNLREIPLSLPHPRAVLLKIDPSPPTNYGSQRCVRGDLDLSLLLQRSLSRSVSQLRQFALPSTRANSDEANAEALPNGVCGHCSKALCFLQMHWQYRMGLWTLLNI
ncbi:uncharacterized protein A4U43_C04F32090 [Asparagus officinalis]|uniref:Uncharacterized protein n=1 Tax=Asparagus officinalis TaxID=4686 RepID=A0A5P1F540_ASPOF|nr:uncharacterized protein A4U43_C04F32090 [Asparagus officinalis]